MSILNSFDSKLIIFDKDGTLIDFYAMWGGWAGQLAERLGAACGIPVTESLFHLYGYDVAAGRTRADAALSYTPMATLREIAGQALREAGCPEDRIEPSLLEAWHVPDPVALATPLTDLAILFAALQARGARIAVATGDDRSPTAATLDSFGVAHFVDALACGDDGFPTKPEPDAVLKLCRDLDLPLANTVMIGDTPADVQMGRSAGAGLVVGVLSGVGGAEDLSPHAHHLIPSIADLL